MLNHLKDDYSTNRVLCQGDKAFFYRSKTCSSCIPGLLSVRQLLLVIARFNFKTGSQERHWFSVSSIFSVLHVLSAFARVSSFPPLS